MRISIRCIREERPGEKWKASFQRTWPVYRKWFLNEGHTARPGYLACIGALEQHMPEIVPLYRDLCELAGGGDVASRYLSMYRPPAYMSGCTQVAWTRGVPALIRNYDYNPRWFEGVLLYTNWLQPVIAVSDCSWGALDGMNGEGLCASLTFGGRNVTGDGFGVPLIVRYVLETCTTVREAVRALRRVGVHMAYNITLMDGDGDHATVFVGPDRAAGVVRSQVCSNHQESIDWPEYARASATAERETLAQRLLDDPATTFSSATRAFLRPPLYSEGLDPSFRTLYTAAWFPGRGEVSLMWPARIVEQSFQCFQEKRIAVNLNDTTERCP